ncbi:MAG: ROK family protein [Pseudomonadota bacterium]
MAHTRESGAHVVVDLGGTNVRFAVAKRADAGAIEFSHITAYRLAAHPSFAAALEEFRHTRLEGAAVARLAIGAAGPVTGGTVALTNAPWTLDADDLAITLNGARVVIVNDLQAVGRALPELSASDIAPLHAAGAQPARAAAAATSRAPRLAVNVGTGFGASACHAVPGHSGPRWLATATEAGHMSDAFRTATAGADATVEDICSGAGLLASANGFAVGPERGAAFASAQDVCANAKDAAAAQALNRFGWTLGGAVRDLVLAHGAWGGVYLTGSVADAWWLTGVTTAFWAAYAGDNPMRAQLDGVPMYRITVDNPALIGLAALLHDPA